MFVLAIALGIFSYVIFFLGISGSLTRENLYIVSFIFISVVLILVKKNLRLASHKKIFLELKKSTLAKLFLVLLFLQAIINLVGALGPELGFDALWYHLTIPKSYLLEQKIYFIPGNLLYYSAMPKLSEMYYVVSLAISNEILAKTIHFLFGIFCCIALYIFAKKYFSLAISFLVVLVFYTNLVVAWESITAYIDLVRTFYEIMALIGFVRWYETKNTKWLLLNGIMTGFAIATKLLALGTLLIFSILIISIRKKSPINGIRDVAIFISISLAIPLPWLVFSYINTGNPVYPFFSGLYPVNFGLHLLYPVQALRDMWNIFVMSADPVLPIFLIAAPVVIFQYKKLNKVTKLVLFYSVFAILLWYVTPRTGGGRFILPYLPAFSFVIGGVVSIIKFQEIKKTLVGIIILLAISSILYRGVANKKYLPVILGLESKHAFLSQNLNFSFGDFYDTDHFFASNVKNTDTVLLYGFHNLYYVDFPFIHESWVKKGDRFNFVAVQNGELPEKFHNFYLVHYNKTTRVKVFTSGKFVEYQ